MEQWLQFALAVPLSGGVLGLLYRVAPVPRWTWAMKGRLSIYRDLPEGPERDWYGAEATKYARLVREYKEAFPRSQKILGWIAVSYTILLLALDVLQGWDKSVNVPYLGAFGPAITVLGLFFWLSTSVNVMRGRTVFGLTPQEHAETFALLRDKHARRAVIRELQNRARRVLSFWRTPRSST